ncbi:MAG: H(+)-transporting ATPase [Bacilli bacterium]|nr:H(+)-transporting ATPase [Bacilli bacterium]
MKRKSRVKKITPYFYVMISFLIVILIGTLLLFLPISKKEGSLSFIDALFTSISATCVTGLAVVPICELTIVGRIIICIFIEIGGLSFLTIAIFVLVILGKRLSIGSRFMMKEALNQNSASDIIPLIKRIVTISFGIQFVFVIINFFIFLASGFDALTSIGYSTFHTISAFNNAGFDIFGYDSMISFSSNIALNISTMLLIVLGGLGFIVYIDIFNFKKRYYHFHTKVVLTMSAFLIVFGTLLIKLMMGNNITWLEAIFTSVTTRTAGFTTIDLSNITLNPVFMILLLLMFIGASPCSTGGGIKTTTVFTLVISILYMAIGKKPKAFNRRISTDSILKAFTLCTMAIFYCLVMTFLVHASLVSQGISLGDVAFEVISAFGTVGLSTGITTQLNVISKIIIGITMFIGRLGPLTIASLWNRNWMKNTNSEVDYIEERIMIG